MARRFIVMSTIRMRCRVRCVIRAAGVKPTTAGSIVGIVTVLATIAGCAVVGPSSTSDDRLAVQLWSPSTDDGTSTTAENGIMGRASLHLRRGVLLRCACRRDGGNYSTDRYLRYLICTAVGRRSPLSSAKEWALSTTHKDVVVEPFQHRLPRDVVALRSRATGMSHSQTAYSVARALRIAAQACWTCT